MAVAFKEPIFQELADLAAHVFNLPISFISVVEGAQVDFVVTHGIPTLHVLPREQALCLLPVKHAQTIVLNRECSADEQQVLEQLVGLISRTVVVRHTYLRQEAGQQRWVTVQQDAIEEIRALEALICYIARRHDRLVPTPISVLLAAGHRLKGLEKLLTNGMAVYSS